MVEYVYARHDFIPEHEDEISFRAGERIEVVLRDDLYSDGWWEGRNLAGKVGLFPESYTQPAPPSTEPPPAAMPATAPLSSALADRAQPSATSLPSTKQAQLELVRDGTSSDTMVPAAPNLSTAAGNGEVMLATLTDVQQAIEQLGHKDDGDGSRSFTFSSSHGDSTDHDTDHDTDAEAGGEDWHRSARQKLAEKAKKVVEEQAAREAAEGRVTFRSSAPPIDVEMSDDSGDEGDRPFDQSSPNGHDNKHPHIPEEDENEPPAPHNQKISYSPSIQPSERYIVPSPISTAHRPESGLIGDAAVEVAVATATQQSFPQNEKAQARTPENTSSLPSPVSPGLRGISNGASADTANTPSSAQLVFPSKAQTLSLQEVSGVLPSPVASSNGHRHGYSISSLTSSAIMAASSPLSAPHSVDMSSNKQPRDVHPSEWNVEDVIDWLRVKGFDDTVCDKFLEQEITGDVLLELDVGVLKSEIGIVAYGKRIRIANAIAELRRPPSVLSSEQPTRSGSLSHGSPLAQQESTVNSPATLPSPRFGTLATPESPPNFGEPTGQKVDPAPAHRDSDPGLRPQPMDSNVTIGLGLGVPASLIPGNGQGKALKGRPPQLSLSPSDSALAANAKLAPVGQQHRLLDDEDRGVLSDSDTKNVATKGRGLFGRQSSSSSTGNARKSPEVTTPRSDISQLSDGARSRPQPRKRSLDTAREGSRLSIFGNTFAGTLGKARKPPPRYSGAPDTEATSPDRSALSLTRFYNSNSNRKTSTRSAPVESSREKRGSRDSVGMSDRRDPTVLRKLSSPTTTGGGSLKSDRSILEQIGVPDHKGWMRKRGDRYNTWTSRYFVLKGPHLYWLKSSNPSETKIKGYLNIVGYRLVADENIDPGKYGFKLVHESDRPHFFSSDEQMAVREWMKALMKATIERDYTKPVVSSVNVPTIPLAVAQAMNPAPRPPSPNARAATQRAMRRENTNQLSTRDAEILMSLSPTPSNGNDRGGNRLRIDSFFSELETEAPLVHSASPKSLVPPVRPPREMRRAPSTSEHSPVEPDLIEWANNHLPSTLQITPNDSVCGGLELLRIAESIKGVRTHLVPDSAFPRGPHDDKLEGLFVLFDFLLDNDVKMGMISINDVRQGKRDKIIQLLKALRAWEEKRRAVLQSIGNRPMQAGPFVA